MRGRGMTSNLDCLAASPAQIKYMYFAAMGVIECHVDDVGPDKHPDHVQSSRVSTTFTVGASRRDTEEKVRSQIAHNAIQHFRYLGSTYTPKGS